MSILSNWELFRDELDRNIKPNLEDSKAMFKPLLDKKVIDPNCFEALSLIRYMAAYEEAIIEFLHPNTIQKQANVKAETLHFGTLYETILKYFMQFDIEKKRAKSKGKITPTNKISFYTAINYVRANYKKQLGENLIKLIDFLRRERNKIHFLENYKIPDGEVVHEEFRLIEIRIKFNLFVSKIVDLI